MGESEVGILNNALAACNLPAIPPSERQLVRCLFLFFVLTSEDFTDVDELVGILFLRKNSP